MKNLFTILTLSVCLNLHAAFVSFINTNAVSPFVPDTNAFKVYPITDPTLNADGSFTTIGVIRNIVPPTNGITITNLAQSCYLVSNAFLTPGYFIRVPSDGGPTVYPSGQLLIGGRSGGVSMFVNVYQSTPTNLTLNGVTNALGFLPPTTAYVQAATNGFVGPAITNGFTDKSVTNGFVGAGVTNGLATVSYVNGLTNGFSGSGITNGFATIGYVNGVTNGFVGTGVTNGLATQAFVQAATNGFTDKSITNNLATQAYARALTNGFTDNSITNNFATQTYARGLTNGFTDKSITNGFVGPGVTNGLATQVYAQGLTNGFTDKSITNVLATQAYVQSLTNGFVGPGSTNGLATISFVQGSTNGFVGAGVTNGLATTNYVGLNYALQSSVPSTNGFVDKSITNGFVTATVTNGLATTAYVQNATNGFVGQNITNGFQTTNGVVKLNTVNNFTASNSFSGGVKILNSLDADSVTVGSSTISSSTVTASSGVFGTISGSGGGISGLSVSAVTNAFPPTPLLVNITGNAAATLVQSTNFSATNTISYYGQSTNFAATNVSFAYLPKSNGVATSLNLQTSLSMGTKTNWLYTTNAIGLGFCGSPFVSGTYEGVPFGTTWTNFYYPFQTIVLFGGVYFAQSNTTALYQSADGIIWTATPNGIAPPPLGAFGHYELDNGVLHRGWFASTNLVTQITNYAQNASQGGYLSGIVSNAGFSAAGSNAIINLIAEFSIDPTNGTTPLQVTNIALSMAQLATNGINTMAYQATNAGWMNTNGNTSTGQIPYSTNVFPGYVWAAPPSGGAANTNGLATIDFTTNLVAFTSNSLASTALNDTLNATNGMNIGTGLAAFCSTNQLTIASDGNGTNLNVYSFLNVNGITYLNSTNMIIYSLGNNQFAFGLIPTMVNSNLPSGLATESSKFFQKSFGYLAFSNNNSSLGWIPGNRTKSFCSISISIAGYCYSGNRNTKHGKWRPVFCFVVDFFGR